MENWKAGFGGLRSIFILKLLIQYYNKNFIRFRHPLFHHSIRPFLHRLFTAQTASKFLSLCPASIRDLLAMQVAGTHHVNSRLYQGGGRAI